MCDRLGYICALTNLRCSEVQVRCPALNCPSYQQLTAAVCYCTSADQCCCANMAPLLLQRPAFATANTSRNAPSSRARSIVVRALKEDTAQHAVQPAPAFLAAAVTASMLLGAQMVVPEDAFAAQTAGRASASKFRSARRAAIS